MLPLSYPHINYVDGSAVLFLQCQNIVTHHPLVRLIQTVVSADHKKLIKGKKRVIMMNLKHASM